MEDESKITLAKDELMNFKLINAEFRAAQAEIQLAQQNFGKKQQEHAQFHEQLTIKLTEHGSWEVLSINTDTGVIDRKITELGKKRREDAKVAATAKVAAEAPPDASKTASIFAEAAAAKAKAASAKPNGVAPHPEE